MKLGIAIATYAREDGKTPFYLKRTLNSVFAQEFQDFKIFITGDDYRPREELDNIVAQYPQDKIHLIHLDYAVEREKYKGDPEKTWNNGGVTAHNIAVDNALAEGFDYLCKLDHDDYWLPRHLKIISETIDKTGADFICTGAVVPNGKLPNIDSKDYLIPFLPKAAGIIQSSTCYNYRTIPIRSRDAGELPSDYDKWKRMAQYIKDNNLKSYFINDCTCIWEPGTYERKKRH